MNKILVIFLTLLAASVSGTASEIPSLITGKDVLGGKEVELALASEDKAAVVVFLSARCPCSASHELTLKKLYEEFSPKGFSFIGVHSNADEDEAMTREHFNGSHLPFPVLQDQGSKISNALGALKTPHVYVIRKGEILFQGGVDDSHISQLAKAHFLRDALTAISQGKEPEVKQARALGCIIKRN